MLILNTMTLKDIIEEIMIEATTPTSIFRNAEKFMVDKHAKTGLKNLNLTFGRSIKGMNVHVPISCRVAMPPDYMQFIRAYLINCDGKTIELKRNNNIPEKIFHYLTSCDGSIIDGACHDDALKDECLVCNPSDTLPEMYCPCKCGNPTLPKQLIQLIKDVDTYGNSWVAVHKDSFEFSADLEELAVVIEYLSNDVNELNQCEIDVPEEQSECLEYFIKYKILEGDLNMMQTSQYFKKEYKRMRDKIQQDNNSFTEMDLKKLFLIN